MPELFSFDFDEPQSTSTPGHHTAPSQIPLLSSVDSAEEASAWKCTHWYVRYEITLTFIKPEQERINVVCAEINLRWSISIPMLLNGFLLNTFV